MVKEPKRNVSVFAFVEVEFLFDGPTRIKHLMPTCSKGPVLTMDTRQKGTVGQVPRLAGLLFLLYYCWIWLKHRPVVVLQNAAKALPKIHALK